jgi:CheY-like chemotaxis protein
MHKTRILVVDDEISITKLLRASLESRGYEVETAVDGEEALLKTGSESSGHYASGYHYAKIGWL